MSKKEGKEIEEVKIYINNEQVGECYSIKIAGNIAVLKKLDYNDDFIGAFRGGNICIEDNTDIQKKRYFLLGCRYMETEHEFPREDYYSDLFRFKFETKEIKGKTTNIKAREKIVLELGDKILNAIQEVNRNQIEPMSLLEVIIACGNAQIAIYEKGYAKNERTNADSIIDAIKKIGWSAKDLKAAAEILKRK